MSNLYRCKTYEHVEFSSLADRTAIIGPPGTGKTYQMEQLIRSAKVHYVYLTYSRSMAQEARKRIVEDPDHVGTFHSILARHLGISSFLKSEDFEFFCKHYGLSMPKHFNNDEFLGTDDFSTFMQKYDYARNTLKPIENDAKLNLKYLAREYEKFKQGTGKCDYTDILVRASEGILPYYDAIFVDEAQDLTPLMWKIVNRWPSKRLILGGDDDQAIFSFKGVFADDFIREAKKSDIVELTVSRRFGDNVRQLAEKVTRGINRIEKHYIGAGQTDIKFMNLKQFLQIPGDKAILTRTNNLSQNVAQSVLLPTWPINPSHSLNNGWTSKTLRLARILNAWPPTDQEDIRYLVQNLPASVLVRGVKSNVEELQPNLYGFDGLFKKKPTPRSVIEYLNIADRQKALLNMYLGKDVSQIVRIDTIHAAKGMEFDNVLFILDKPFNIDYSAEEKRIVYTGITRVKKLLAFAYMDYYRDQYRLY